MSRFIYGGVFVFAFLHLVISQNTETTNGSVDTTTISGPLISTTTHGESDNINDSNAKSTESSVNAVNNETTRESSGPAVYNQDTTTVNPDHVVLRKWKNRVANPAGTTVNPDEPVIQKWKKLVADSSNGVDTVLRQLMPLFLSSDVQISTECTSSLFKIILGLRQLKNWVIQMIDATGKISSGVLEGSTNFLGDYDECLSILVTNDYSGQEEFKGQYCSLMVKPEIPPRSGLIDLHNFTSEHSVFRQISRDVFRQANMEFRIGVCIPSSCSEKDLTKIVSSAVTSYPFTAEVIRCEMKQGWIFTWDQILTLFMLTILVIVLIVSTVAMKVTDKEQKKKFPISLMTHFDVTLNFRKLVHVEESSSSLACVNGIKVFCMMWIIVVHSYALIPPIAYAKAGNILTLVRDRMFVPIANASLSVDSFFVAGGLMVSYLTLKYMAKSQGKIPFTGFIIRRLWRLYPGVLIVLGGVMLLPLLGSGPIWEDTVIREVDVCRRSWWGTVFFVNSWQNYFDMCMVHTWYLSNDMHFFLLSPILLYILYRKPIVGVSLVFTIILAGALTVGILTYTRDLHPSIIISEGRNVKLKETMEMTYFKPYAHVGPYYLGFLLGYLLFKLRDIHLNTVQVIAGWSVSAFLGLIVIYSPYDWYYGNLPSPLISTLYQSTHRIAFGLAICWVIFACAYGYGGFVNSLLSWKGFSPLNRLTYLMYLVQMPVIWVKNGARRDTIMVYHRDVLNEIFGNFIVITAIASVLYVAVEAPFCSMDVEFFGKRVKAKRQSSEKRNARNIPIPKLVVTDENTSSEIEKGLSNGGFVVEEMPKPPEPELLPVVVIRDSDNLSQISEEDKTQNHLNAVFADHTPKATPIGIRRAIRMGVDVKEAEMMQSIKQPEESTVIESKYLSITNNYDNTPVATPIRVRKTSKMDDTTRV